MNQEETKTREPENQVKENLGFIVDVFKGTAEPVLFRNELADYYRLLNCNLIDIVEAEIGGRLFDIIVDDEGLMKEDPKPSAFDKDEKPLLCGSLLLCHNDPETGHETALTNEDITLLLSKIVQVDRPGKPEEKPYKALLGLKM